MFIDFGCSSAISVDYADYRGYIDGWNYNPSTGILAVSYHTYYGTGQGGAYGNIRVVYTDYE